jgi:hypothetical protein
MNFISPSNNKNIIPGSFLLFFLILVSTQSSDAALRLDKDAVFCSYFMISGDEPSEQDIEELCFNSGRPSYTAFKPSEMFSKKSLLSEKKKIENRISTISADPTIIWNIKLDSMDAAGIELFFTTDSINDNMPNPTPYISGRISENGPKYIRKTVAAMLDSSSAKKYGKGVEILISLRPVHAVYEYEKRNIVEQMVTLPIRYVIFQPIKVQILDGNRSNN